MFARSLVVSLVLFACTSAETPAGTPGEAPAKVEEPAKVEAKVEAKVMVEAPTTATPPAAAVVPSDEPIVSWWCTCYYKYGEGEPEAVTACRSAQSDCTSLEKGVMAGKSGIVPRSVTHPCQESKAAHPGDSFGGREQWTPSKKAGSWLSVGECRLPGAGKEVDLEARLPEAENIMSREKIGELKLWMKAKEVVTLIGEPASKGKDEEWGADGAFHQDWNWPALGLRIDMVSGKRRGEKESGSITIEAPSAFKTAKGIGIGSPRAEAMKQYGKLRDPDFSDDLEKQLIAGSIYGGLFFNFEKDKVVSIFLGQGAE
jgi:hypothetical protein